MIIITKFLKKFEKKLERQVKVFAEDMNLIKEISQHEAERLVKEGKADPISEYSIKMFPRHYVPYTKRRLKREVSIPRILKRFTGKDEPMVMVYDADGQYLKDIRLSQAEKLVTGFLAEPLGVKGNAIQIRRLYTDKEKKKLHKVI